MLAPKDDAGRPQVLVPEDDHGHGHGGNRERVLAAVTFAENRN